MLEPVDHRLAASAIGRSRSQRAELALHLVEQVARSCCPGIRGPSRSFATSRNRLLGPGGGLGASYSEIAPQIATRPLRPQRADRGLEVVAADVVEVDVDPIGRGLAQKLGERP